MSALVLLACSATKAASLTPLPASKLYQGVMYQTLRAHRPIDNPAGELLTVMIVSAEHGLILEDDDIETYNRRMTAERADELIARGFPDDMHFDGPTFDAVLLAGGSDYRRVMRAYVAAMQEFGQIEPDAVITEVSGGIGEQRHQLAQFLQEVDGVPA